MPVWHGAFFFGTTGKGPHMKKLRSGEGYAGRSPNVTPMSLSFDKETALMIDALAPSRYERSEYLSRLVHEDRARREERQRIVRDIIAPE